MKTSGDLQVGIGEVYAPPVTRRVENGGCPHTNIKSRLFLRPHFGCSPEIIKAALDTF